MKEIKVTLEGETEDKQLLVRKTTLNMNKPATVNLCLRQAVTDLLTDEIRVYKGETAGISILTEAEQIINGPRRDAYGPVEESFERIALTWSGILGHPITAQQVALMMIGLKVCREANSHHRDNLVDIVGYTLLKQKLGKNNKDTENL